MPRYKLTIEYYGAPFSGWQIQPDSTTVEGELEKAFSQILQQPVDLIGQGRTDAGVHAKGQVAHVDLPEGLDLHKLTYGVNGLTGEHIHIQAIEVVHAEFHARFDATAREYEYHVLTAPSPLRNQLAWWPGSRLDPEKLSACSELIIGEHDFDGFSKFSEDNYTTLCTVINAGWEEQREGELVFSIQANRFLRNMVRRPVGTMAEAAAGKIPVQEFRAILDNPSSDAKTYTAPAKGLVLSEVFYEKN